VWKVGGKSLLVYMVPGTEDDPVYMSWEVPNESTLEEFFGPDQTPVYNREISQQEYDNLGVLDFGSTNELNNFSEDPFAGWAAEVEMQASTQPWIMDEDYQALMAQAVLEGRDITQAEIQTTSWWQDHTAAERSWMETYHGDPATAEQILADNRQLVRDLLTEAGAGTEVDESVINYMADKFSHGTWSRTYLNGQISALTDPSSPDTIDSEMNDALDLSSVGTTNVAEDTVRSLLHTWLGPAFGDWDNAEISRIAGLIRNDPTYEARFVEQLKDERLALLPEYGDREMSYQAVSNTWKQWWMGQWGEAADEKSDLFMKVLKNNDMAESGKLLRSEGLKRGVKKVVDDFSGESIRQSGGGVRSGIYV
jgi:hypothetical protein